jgi:serine protease AprX
MLASWRARRAFAVASSIVAALAGGLIAQDEAAKRKTPQQERKAPQEPPYLRETEDVGNRVFAAQISKGRVLRFLTSEIPREAFSHEPFDQKKDERPEPVREPGRIHPLLKRWLDSRPGGDAVSVVINLRDDFRIPRFPEPATDEPRDGARNKRALRRAEELVKEITGRRAGGYEEIVKTLRESYKAEVGETFWLVKAVTAKVSLDAVRRLAERKDVMYLEPVQTEDKPPQDANANNDVDDGRARLNSDPYFNVGLAGGFIGLLDSGMRFSHRQFNSPSHVAFRRDCVNGGADCNTGTALNPNDDCWNHGTSSAAIITANARDGAAFRGVTGITLDSFKVYPSTFDAAGNCTGGLDTAAAVRGFQRAVAVLDRVIVAEMQGSGDYLSSVSVAADNAFDAGAVVIAANGNNGPGASTVNAPASAHRVIGIGNFDVQSQTQVNSQSRGPTPDNRFKPDLQTPTNTETASTGCPFGVSCTMSDTAFRVFGGTSGATPYGGGAAGLVRNFLRGTSFSIDPGQVYSFLILSGQKPYPFDNTTGAGPIRLPTDGWAWWGKVSVRDGDTIEIPIDVGGSPNRLDAALWWPETAWQFLFFTVESHNDVDLSLVDPGGSVRAFSVSIPSVFERARVSGTVAAGRWKVRVRGFRVAAGPQTVYWAAAAHRQ